MDGINNNNKNYHVLVLPYPTQGHINPILQFSKRLVSKGIKATLATTIFVQKSIQASGSRDPGPSPGPNISIDTISDGYDDGGRSIHEIEVYLETFRDVGSRTLADLIRRLAQSGRPVHAVVYDAFLPWALDVAKGLGLVGAPFFTQSCAVNAVYYSVHKGLVRLPLSSEETVSIPSLPPLDPSETPSFVYLPESFPGFYHLLVNQFYKIDKADFVFFNNFYDLEEKTVEWMSKLWRVRTVGPTVPSFYLDKGLENDEDYGMHLFKPDKDTCMSWLNDKPFGSVVYVSFGSVAGLEPEQVQELAWSLKGSEYYFLWVVRESEEPKLPQNFKEETSEKGLVLEWCPQLEVLAHESVGCFVTHCGFNSTLEALSLGVPLVAVPQWTDQPTNAKYVEDVWGVGIRARPEKELGIVRREVLEICIKEVMEGEKGKEFKKNAIKWSCLAKEAVSEGGSSDKNIDEFVAQLASL